MKPSLNTIIRTLNAAPSGVVKLGGTTFTLYDIPERRKVAAAAPWQMHSNDRSDHAKAMQLYGSELEAAAAIRRQLSALGGDCDPAVRRRAETLADRLERGHKLRPQYHDKEVTHYTVAGEWSKGILGNVNLWQRDIDALRKEGYNLITPTPAPTEI